MSTTTTLKTILIVEDEPLLLQSLIDKFTADGFKAIGARNGEEGLEVALRNHPDLILLDIVMPKMDGMTMLRHLRDDSWGKQAPIMLLTNLSDYKSVADALDQGVHDFLVKTNWSLEAVVQKVKDKFASLPE